MQIPYEKRTSWLDRPLFTTLVISAETILFALILVLGAGSRFYDLGTRVVSHDETIHYYHNSWSLFRGQGYRHDPLSHGPLQFHFMALAYFVFGDSDFAGRLPHALFGIATIAFLWFYRRYLGRAGALVAAGLLLISPYMLYYARYARNEALVAFFGVVMLWGMLRYLETGRARYTYWFIAAAALHFTAKETAFIYAAQALIFLALYFVYRVIQNRWPNQEARRFFIIVMLIALLLLAAAGVVYMTHDRAQGISSTETATPAVPGAELAHPMAGGNILLLILLGLAVAALLIAAYFLLTGYTWRAVRNERSFDLLILLGTMVLPMLAPFPVNALGLNPIDYNNQQTITATAILLPILIVIAIALGFAWKWRLWLVNAAIFYAIFTVFFTTVFTNGFGMVTGLVGSLGYWLEQQGVERGSQPWYYYALLQVPIYEYLPALGSLLTMGLAAYHWIIGAGPIQPPSTQDVVSEEEIENTAAAGGAYEPVSQVENPPVFTLLAFWAVTSLIAFSIAGEKMPWLTVHIAWPAALLAALGIGYLIETTNWAFFRERRGWLILALLPVFLVSALIALGTLLGTRPPFQGQDLESLNATSTFVTALVSALVSGAGLYYLVKPWPAAHFLRVIALFSFAFLGVLTLRTAFRAAYINHNDATEYLVYAHAAGGVKEALAQIEEISRRTTDGLGIHVAYDNETAYPFFWYLRNYPNARYYGENPTRSLREAPVILVDDNNFGKIEPVVGQGYQQFDYIRMWWPDQDYFGLTLERTLYALTNPEMRSAIFQIWLNRDYKQYSQLVNKDLSLQNWPLVSRMRLYVRKDIISQIWNYGAAPAEAEVVVDPYEGKQVNLVADRVIGSNGTGPGQFQGPRDLVVASDGSLYVADTGNHRIQHLAQDGTLIHVWGSFADAAAVLAQGGTFNQPWGIALGPDGSVYVADTWNHRIQKFTASGEFVKMWGVFDQSEAPNAFWGPRDVAVDAQGRVFVTDTGNKRVSVYDADGNFLTRFGSEGLAPGQFDENVGLALSSTGQIYVTDTWNQRIQVFSEVDGTFQFMNAWDVIAWYGQSLDNKPYIAVDELGRVFVSDPEGSRVLEFTADGQFVQFWGDPGSGPEAIALAASIAFDPDGGVWVSDAGNHRLMHFVPPAAGQPE